MLKEGAYWSIGEGNCIPLFDNKWTADRSFVKPRQSILFNPFLRVDYLIIRNRKIWNETLRFLLDDNSSSAVLKNPLFASVLSDSLSWKGEKSGLYSVRSAYRLIMQNILNVSHLRVDGCWGCYGI